MKLTRSNYQSMDKFVAFLAIKFILNAPLEPLSKLNNVNDNLPMDKSFLNLCAGQIALPPPPGQPRRHHFFGGCPGLLITLFFPCPALYKHSNHSFFQCHALIYHTHFSSHLKAFPGGMGAEQFDRRIKTILCLNGVKKSWDQNF